MNRITSTQYLKVGDATNVGVIKQLHEYKGITTTDGFFWDLNETEVFKISKNIQAPIGEGSVGKKKIKYNCYKDE